MPDWIAVDWGTSNLRAFAMQGSTAVAKAASEDGMSKLSRNGFEPALRRLIDPWLTRPETPVIACGMVGSRQGWVDAPYRSVPCKPLGDSLVAAPSTTGLRVGVVPGLRQSTPPDVMRGEETQIAGFLALNPGFDGVLCLPGTHTKWAHLSAGEVVSFRTFMTGELFALLSTASVLSHSVATDAWDAPAFLEGARDAMARPEGLAAALFTLRAAHLLEGTAAGALRARLSGLLTGAELAAARPYWLGQNIAILGLESQARAYRDALQDLGAPALMVDGERATLEGLKAARSLRQEPA